MSEEKCPKCGAGKKVTNVEFVTFVADYVCESYQEGDDFYQSGQCRIRELEREAWIWKRAFEMATTRAPIQELLCRVFIESPDLEHFECPFEEDECHCSDCFAMWLPQMAEAEWEERNDK